MATPSTKSIDHYPDTLIAHGQWSELRYRPRDICRERKTGAQQQGTFKTSRSEYGDSGESIQESLHRKILKQFLKRAALRARFDITQALAVSELREGHAQELVAGEAARPAVAMVAATQRRNSRSGKWEISCENTVRPRFMPHGALPAVQIAASEKPPSVAVLQLVAQTAPGLAGH